MYVGEYCLTTFCKGTEIIRNMYIGRRKIAAVPLLIG